MRPQGQSRPLECWACRGQREWMKHGGTERDAPLPLRVAAPPGWYSLRIGSDTHSWTFSFNPKRDDQGLNPLFVDVGRNQDIGIQNQADHLERRLSHEGFCPFRTAATSLSIWPALSLLAPAVKVINHYGDEVLKVFPA